MNSTDGNFSCVSGGTWWVCSEPRFVGCCISNPCANLSGQGCPIEDLRSASFNINYYTSIGVNDCTDFAGSKWYTCAAITPSFLGCCKVNPCIQHQCPTGSLTGALWRDQQEEQIFLDGAADPSAEVSSLITTSSTSSSSATSPVPATTSASVTTSAGEIISSASSSSARNPVQATTPASVTTSTGDSSSTTIQSSNNGSGISTSTIVGIGIAAFVVIVILIAVIMFKCGWDARKRGGRGTMAQESSLMTTDHMKSSLSPDRDPHASSIVSRSPQNWNAFDSPDMNSYHFPSRPYQSPTIAGETYGTTELRVDRYQDSVRAHGLYTGGLPPHFQELDAIEQQLPAELSEPYMGNSGTHKY